MKHVVIVGGGFAGLNAAKVLGNQKGVNVTLLDKKNHHLFQPLLYQVAMAGLSPAEIAAPIRSLLSHYKNVTVLHDEVIKVNFRKKKVSALHKEYPYDYLILACGAKHSYFGKSNWEKFAPGLKTLEQATEIRRRVLIAFENAEREKDILLKRKHLTFVVVGGGPTGVELAGAIGEMSRYTLAKDFKHIDPKLTRVLLIEGGPRILPSFKAALASRAARDLENLGVHIWVDSQVTKVDDEGVKLNTERVQASTVLWAAGVKATLLKSDKKMLGDKQGRLIVEKDLSLKDHAEVFVVGDQAHFAHQTGKPLPGLSPVALQGGQHAAKNILHTIHRKPRKVFKYLDKGQMATIGRSKAIAQIGKFGFSGFSAWLAWLFVHIYYLTGFKNRLFVVFQWGWSYFTFKKGARLIVNKEWKMYDKH